MGKKLWVPFALLFIFIPYLFSFAEGAGSYSIAGFDDSDKVDQFVKKLQEWVRQNKKEEIANAIRFPITITRSGRRFVLRNRRDFLRYYPDAFNSKVKNAILKQDSSNLFANWQGAMIGNGEIWIHHISNDDSIKIITINN